MLVLTKRCQSLGWAVVLCATSVLAVPDARIALDHPIQISVHRADNTPLVGRVVAYDAQGFELVQGKDKSLQIAWSALDAHNVFLVRAALLAMKDSAGWIDLGRDLLASSDGAAWANKAFDHALRIDPALKAQVAQARVDAAAHVSAPANGNGDHPNDPNAASAAPGGGPRLMGDAGSDNWVRSTDAQRKEQVARLAAFAEDAATTLKRPLKAQETQYFLFYSDLHPAEAAKWGGLLDRMYDRLAELFAVPKGENIWRGKGLIFVFTRADDYRNYERNVEHADPGESAGITNAYGDGIVHIAFYRQNNELNFAHVLVHESVHGFLHRYRSPVHIVSWINEGLAETIAAELVPDPGRALFIPGLARQELHSHKGNLGDFFTAGQIEGWQYPVAETLTVFMIKSNKKNYVDFINGMKDGLSWKESLEQKYQAKLDDLLNSYAKSINERIAEPKVD